MTSSIWKFYIPALSQPISAWYPLEGHTYLNKPATGSYRFV